MMLSTITSAETHHEGLDPEAIAKAVFDRFDSCNVRPSDASQYTILAGFVLSNSLTKDVKVPALATGAKCLPTSRYPNRGDALHDFHAEVLARRSLIRWLYDEVSRAVHTSGGSPWLELCSHSKKYTIEKEVRLSLYVSTVPCGDASMRFLAASQDPEMAALKDSEPAALPPVGTASRGRDGYSHHGVLRTKPGRADSPPTRCMSCSDKLASWNVLGLQGALAARIFQPVYLDEIVIGDVPRDLRETVREDCERAFFERLEGIDRPCGNFRLAKPKIHFTDSDFKFSRTSLQRKVSTAQAPAPCNESLTWAADTIPPSSGLEVLVNGTRRGVSPKQRALDKFLPRTCKLQLFRQHDGVARSLGLDPLPSGIAYHEAKAGADSNFRTARTALKGPGRPFAGWVVSGREWESFDTTGTVLPLEVSQLTGDRSDP